MNEVLEVEQSECDHCSAHTDFKWKRERFVLGTVLFFIAVLLPLPFVVKVSLYLISYIFVGGEVVIQALRNLRKGQIFDENLLMSIATIGAFAIQEFPEGVAVMIFYQIGEYFQEQAVTRSKKSIALLMGTRPDYANKIIGGEIVRTDPKEVGIGDLIVIRPGEKIPLDGRITEGMSMIDTSALTGESMPREVEEGDEVLSGSVNMNGLLTVVVTKDFGESTLSKILDLVQNANNKKAHTEKFITKFARYYTPIVVIIAAVLAFVPPLIIQGEVFSVWIHRALVFLVVSCPCALVISIPLAFFGGIGGASRNGILVKGGNYLEALNNVDTVVFDKTGTLTKGRFHVEKILSEGQETNENILTYAALAESFSNHPIAKSILKAYGKEVNKNEIESYEELSGFGIRIRARGKEVLVGNSKLLHQENIVFNEGEEIGTIVYVVIDKKYVGYLVITDELKEDSYRAIQELRELGIKRMIMLTGDNRAVGERIGEQLGIDEIYTELLPGQKVEKLDMIKKQTSGGVLFVGDGINDSPVLVRADVGIAMGGIGSDAAIEAADIVIMTDEPSKIVTAIKIAKKTRSIVWQNIGFAIGVKVIVLILGAGGIATMWEAVFADVGVALIAIMNAMRVMKFHR